MDYSNDLSLGVAQCYGLSGFQPDNLNKTKKPPSAGNYSIVKKNLTIPFTKQCKRLHPTTF